MNKALVLAAALLLCWLPQVSQATPTQFGVTGLLSQPTADTLDSGNLAVGLWFNSSETTSTDATLVPVSLTMGLGTFLEAYGSYPNLLFNDEEAASGRGYANVGFKARVLGKRSSPLKLSLDIQARRHISDDVNLDGLTDLLGRSIVSFKKGRLGLHLNGGYLQHDADFGFDDQILGGLGIEFYPMARLRLIAELEAATEKQSGLDEEMEATAGFQYFISPHLTFHAGFGTGLTDSVADWRVLVGLTTSQGIGTYTKPVPRIVESALEDEKAKKEPVKKAKFKPLTPLIPKARKVKAEPIDKLELPVTPGEEEVVIEPAERLDIPGTVAIKGAPVTPISPPAPEQIKQPRESFKTDTPFKTVVYRKFRFDELSYEFDQSTLSEAGMRAIALVAEKLREENKWFVLRVNGHTDAIGSDQYNEELSFKRAISVAKQLVVNEGFDPARIFVKGLGETAPIASNADPEGRSRNRRSEILVLLPK